MLNTSACSRLPSAAASSSERDVAAEPGDDGARRPSPRSRRAAAPARRSAAVRLGSVIVAGAGSGSGCGRHPAGSSGAGGRRRTSSPRTGAADPADSRSTIARRAAPTAPPMISQITWLTWADADRQLDLAPERVARRGRSPRSSRCARRAVGGRLEQPVVARLASRSTASGTVDVHRRARTSALMRTVTGSSRPLVTVAENGPVLLDRVTRRGPVDRDRAELVARSTRCVRRRPPRARHGVLAGGVRQVAQRCRRGSARPRRCSSVSTSWSVLRRRGQVGGRGEAAASSSCVDLRTRGRRSGPPRRGCPALRGGSAERG